MVDLTFLSSERQAAVVRFCAAIEQGLGEKLRAVLLVGDGVPPAELGASDVVELLAIVTDLPVPALSNLAHQLGRAGAPLARVRVLTEHELLRSADVFTLQLADYQARHLMLVGASPLGDLHFTRGELRRSIEQTLRALGWRLRDALLAGAGQPGRSGTVVATLLAESLTELRRVAYHLLDLVGEPRPAARAELLGRLAKAAGASAVLLESLRARADGDAPSGEAAALIGDLLGEVERITAFVDGIGAGE